MINIGIKFQAKIGSCELPYNTFEPAVISAVLTFIINKQIDRQTSIKIYMR